MTIVLLFATGLFSGTFASTTGGAGLITLPILLLMGFPPVLAIATLRPAILFLELISVLRLKKERLFTSTIVKEGIFFGVFASIGALFGAFYMVRTPPEHLKGMVAIFLVVMLVLSFTNIFHKRFNLHHVSARTRWSLVTLGAILFGMFAGYFGFAFAVLFLLLMNATTNQPMMQNVAVSRVTGLLLSIAATIFYIRVVPLDISATATLAIGFGLGGWLGIGMSIKHGERYIRILLTFVVTLSLIKLFLP